MKRKMLALVLAVMMIVTLFPVSVVASDYRKWDLELDSVEVADVNETAKNPPIVSSTHYIVNGVTVWYDMVDWPGSGQCWAYANSIYKIIWGYNFDSTFVGTSQKGYNMLRNLSDNERLINPTNTERFIKAAEVGAVIRVTNAESWWSSWNHDGQQDDGTYGHNMILISKSNTGCILFDSTSSGLHERNFTWAELSTYLSSTVGSYKYYKYIKWPGAPEFSSYISQCTPYHCYATITAKPNAKLWTLPCSDSTNPESQNPINCSSSGESFTTTAIYKNTYSEPRYWYRVTKNGNTYYLYAGNVTNVSLQWDVSISNPDAPSSLTQGSSYSIGGTIYTTNLKLSYVSSYVYSGSNTSGTALTGTYANVNTSSYSLLGSPLDTGTVYGSLSTGTYTTVFAAKATNNYSSDGTTIQTSTRTFSTLYTKQFTVNAPAPTVYDLSLSTYYIYKYVNDSEPTTVTCSYTASKFTIATAYYIDDTSVCTCSWGAWSGDSCPLYVYPEGVGQTTITVTLENYDTGEVLDTEYITVVVDGDPWIDSSLYEISTIEGDTSTYEAMISCGGFLPDLYWFRWNVDDTSICTASWGSWINSTDCPLYLTPTGSAGSTTVRVYLIDGSDESIIECVCISVVVYPNVSLNDALNAEEGLLSFQTTGSYPFHVQFFDDEPVAISGNAGIANSESLLSTRVFLNVGDRLGFWYKYSTETYFDCFRFLVNEQSYLYLSGDSETFKYYEFEAFTTGIFTFSWTYTKDGSIDGGEDYVMIDGVSITRNWVSTPDLTYALNQDNSLTFYSEGNSSFIGDYWYGDNVECLYVPTNTIIPGEEYLICKISDDGNAYVMDNDFFITSNNRNLFARRVALTNVEGLTCILSGIDSGMEWVFSTSSGGYVRNVENGCYLTLNGNYLTLSNQGIEWGLEATPGNTTAVLSNDVNAYFKYLGTSSSNSYFAALIVPQQLQLFRKMTRYTGDAPMGDTMIATSSNSMISNSVSSVSTTINMFAGDTLEFKYFVSSELNYDWYNFYINGETFQHISGSSHYWNTYVFTAPANGTYTFTWEYSKDGSVNSGMDCVKLNDIRFTHQSFLIGDVDGNGVVNANDALIVMRYSLGITNDIDFAAADVNGDGVVNANDALLILRVALGIITL